MPRDRYVAERQIAARQAREYARVELTKQLGLERSLREAYRHEEDAEVSGGSADAIAYKRWNRLQKEQDQELLLEENALQVAQARLEKVRLAQQEDALAQELARREQDRLRDEKLRQSARENSEELRKLKQQLLEAYTNKERHIQLLEHQHRLIGDKQRLLALQETMKKQVLIDEENDRKVEEEAKKKQVVYQEQLGNQLQEKAKENKENDVQRFLAEKQMIDAIVQKLHAEDEEQLRKRLGKRMETRAFIDEFIKERALWIKAERHRMEDEDKQIRAFQQMQQAREDERRAMKAHVAAERDNLYKLLSAKMSDDENKRRELEDLRTELQLQQQEQLAFEKEKRDLELRLRRRLELLDAYATHQKVKEQRHVDRLQEEQIFREQMLAQLAEQDRLSQLSDQKRRMKNLEHRKAVEQMIVERRHKIEEEKLADDIEIKKIADADRLRHEIIELERQRILREHAQNVLAYLPKNVLRSERELHELEQYVKSQGVES